MKIYISSHDQQEALGLSKKCKQLGHSITSSWVYADFKPTKEYTETDRRLIAEKDIKEVEDSDCLILLSCKERVPGGKFVETGIAIGLHKSVLILGERENMLMWTSRAMIFENEKQLLIYLGSE